MFSRLRCPGARQSSQVKNGFCRSKKIFLLSAMRSHSWSTSNLKAANVISESDKVAFVGLGRMGFPMACNLANGINEKSKSSMPASSRQNDFQQVVAYDTNENTRKVIYQEYGILTTEQIEDIRNDSECLVIILMLPSCEAVGRVMSTFLSQETGSSFPRVFIDSSTVSPYTSQHWSRIAKEQNSVYIDAPVSGGVKGATEGSLSFLVGADFGHDVEAIQPILEHMGSRIFHCGESGTGSSTKLCNNLALALQMIGIAEAMNLGESLGVDPVKLATAMNMSTAKCWSSEVNNPHPVVGNDMYPEGKKPPSANDYAGGFASSLMRKDLSLALEAAERAHEPIPLTNLAKSIYDEIVESGLADKDFGIVLQHLKRSH